MLIRNLRKKYVQNLFNNESGKKYAKYKFTEKYAQNLFDNESEIFSMELNDF